MFSHRLGRSKLLAGALLALLMTLLVWSPWLTEADARERAVDSFTDSWQGVIDGCGFGCAGCGARETQRILFGYRVRLDYACGIRSMDAPGDHHSVWVLVSVLGTVHGVPEP
jgi:hypothetical protein